MTQQTVELIDHYGTDLTPVNAARVSMNKESGWEEYEEAGVDSHGAFTEIKRRLSDKDVKLIKYLADHGHTSCFEHQSATLRLKVPIFVARQIHRHRTFAYNEVSRRYVKDELEFYWPDKWRKAADNVKQGSSDEEAGPFLNGPPGDLEEYERVYGKIPLVSPQRLAKLSAEYCVMMYKSLVEEGKVAPEQARMILPQNLMTTFYMSGNLRAWSHFLKLRLDPHAQKEIRDVAEMARDLLTPLWPISMGALMDA